jgi:hypothetical protein
MVRCREQAPWYAAKSAPSYLDMNTTFRRVLIAAQFRPRHPTQEIRAIS